MQTFLAHTLMIGFCVFLCCQPVQQVGKGFDDANPSGEIEVPEPKPEPVVLQILSPLSQQSFERDQFDSQFVFVTEPIIFLAESTDPAIVSVEYLTEFDFSLGTGSAPDFEVISPFRIDGLRTITAIGRDKAGNDITTATIQFEIRPPLDEDCLERLTQAGVDFTLEDDILGIYTPVRFKSPLGGIDYLPFGASEPRSNGELASCALTETLLNSAPSLVSRGITTIEHLGIYNFRCIGGGDPRTDDCTPSEHAFALGIDLHEFRDANGTTFNVETDFVIDPNNEATCLASTNNAKDELLHRVACDDLFDAQERFHIVLTPNFNSAHRNHFHVDLKAGSNFIRSLFSPIGIDPLDYIEATLGH